MKIPKMMMSAGFGGMDPAEKYGFTDIESKLERFGYQAEEEIVYGDDSEGIYCVRHSQKWLDSDSEVEDEEEWTCEIRVPANYVEFQGPDDKVYKYTFDEVRQDSWRPPSDN